MVSARQCTFDPRERIAESGTSILRGMGHPLSQGSGGDATGGRV